MRVTAWPSKGTAKVPDPPGKAACGVGMTRCSHIKCFDCLVLFQTPVCLLLGHSRFLVLGIGGFVNGRHSELRNTSFVRGAVADGAAG